MRYGVTAITYGTVYSFEGGTMLVKFDPDKAGGACANSVNGVRRIPGVKVGDRVKLQYVTAPSSGLWYASTIDSPKQI
jgi:hypothetical protein